MLDVVNFQKVRYLKIDIHGCMTFLVPHLYGGETLVVGLETSLNSHYIAPYKSSKWRSPFGSLRFEGLKHN